MFIRIEHKALSLQLISMYFYGMCESSGLKCLFHVKKMPLRLYSLKVRAEHCHAHNCCFVPRRHSHEEVYLFADIRFGIP